MRQFIKMGFLIRKKVLAFGLVLVPLVIFMQMLRGPDLTAHSNQTPDPANPTVAVSIGDFFFSPSAITISGGDTITWTQNGSFAHTVTGIGGTDSSWDSGTLQPGEIYSRTFNMAGTISYICSIHPASMSGEITVLPVKDQFLFLPQIVKHFPE